MIGDRLKSARLARSWSQGQLAREADVPQPVISRLEGGQRNTVTSDVLLRLARSLGVSADFLLGTWEDIEPDAPRPKPSAARAKASARPKAATARPAASSRRPRPR